MPLLQRIKELSSAYFTEVVSIRQQLHANPELSFCEVKTAKLIASKLSEYGIAFQPDIAGTGIVALIHGSLVTNSDEKKCIALRADMDALPINEQNTISYKSKNKDVMHACGHDAHSASLLGTAKILNELRNEFTGTIKLIFQPGEEKFPGGASLMIKEGVLENPSPESIFAQHVSPEIPVGKIGFRAGMYMASADELYVTVRGVSGHAAFPEHTVNPLLIASEILLTLENEFMKKPAPGGISTVLSFGKIIANGATNVIPGELKIDGTFRTMNEEWRGEAQIKMKKMAEAIAEKMGGSCDFIILKGYPFLINDEKITLQIKKYAEEYVGKENVIEVAKRMGAEDFAYYSQKIPACFYRLGAGNIEKNIISGLHTPTFDIDENALETGMGLMAWIAINELSI